MSAPGTTTSGGYPASSPATDIITDAFRNMGVTEDFETPSADMYADALKKLNGLVGRWYASGIHIWVEKECVLFLQQGQARYLVGGETTDHFADAFSYAQDSLSSAAAASATSIVLADASEFEDGDQIGIVLDSGETFWTTIDGDPSGDTVALTDALTGAAAAMNLVYGYTDNIVRPLRVPRAARIQWTPLFVNQIETPLSNMLSRQEYMNLPNKLSPGTVTQVFYNPARVQGEMFVWPTPTNGTTGIRFTAFMPMQTFLAVADQADFPAEWNSPLGWNLAKELGPSWSVDPERWAVILKMADETHELVQGWDREPQPVYFGVSMDQTARSNA